MHDVHAGRRCDCDQWPSHREPMSLPGLPPETGIGRQLSGSLVCCHIAVLAAIGTISLALNKLERVPVEYQLDCWSSGGRCLDW